MLSLEVSYGFCFTSGITIEKMIYLHYILGNMLAFFLVLQ